MSLSFIQVLSILIKGYVWIIGVRDSHSVIINCLQLEAQGK